jgi:hypothetical protein
MDSQLPPAPTMLAPDKSGRAGGGIELRCPRGKIHYTLDGSDPRQPGGAVSPKAQIYQSPVPSKAGVTLIARAFNNGVWSAPLRVKL